MMQRFCFERVLERVLGRDGLGPCVDHPVADLDVLGPDRHETPVEDRELATVRTVDHGVDVGRGRDVEVLGQQGLGQPCAEVPGELIGRSRGDEASTHRL